MVLYKNIGFIFILVSIIVLYLVKKYYKKEIDTETISIGNGQTIGQRDEQEDSFATIKNEGDILSVVADGMGGLGHGKTASKLAIDTFLEQFSRQYNIDSVSKFLINTLYISNEKIMNNSEGRDIGTTLVAIFIRENELYWASAGDSHIYIFKQDEQQIELLNEPHTYENLLKEAYRSGEISREKLLNSPKKERLTSYLGYKDFHKIDYSNSSIPLNSGDKVLLCTDGVYKTMSEIEIEDILAQDLASDQISNSIMEMIEQKNIVSQDNATVIVAQKN